MTQEQLEAACIIVAADASPMRLSTVSGELRYTAMPPVGQAVILFGKMELLKAQFLKAR